MSRSDHYSHEATELELFIVNDYAVYRAYLVPTARRLARIYDRGEFIRERGLKAMRRVCDEAARMYHLEHGSPWTPWYEVFPKGDRDRVAEVLLDGFLEARRTSEPYWA